MIVPLHLLIISLLPNANNCAHISEAGLINIDTHTYIHTYIHFSPYVDCTGRWAQHRSTWRVFIACSEL